MIIGQDRTGKTSLKKSLKGETFNPNEKSTVGIETDPSYFKVSTDVWRTGVKSKGNKLEQTFSCASVIDSAPPPPHSRCCYVTLITCALVPK